MNDEIKIFVEKCTHNSTSEFALEQLVKERMYTGFYALHQFDKYFKIPIVIANFVLMDYGTGAIFCCPAHDQCDFELVQNTQDLEMIQIGHSDSHEIDLTKHAYIYEQDDVMINSGFLDGLRICETRKKIIDKFEELRIGIREINYRLRDRGDISPEILKLPDS